jgi:uncharacterized protein YndB with AHSA1/START domain
MSQVTTGTGIQGPIEQVFDLVTTARYWPLWHPATVAVSGAIDHPMRLGDVIREHARIAGVEGEGDWTVVEYERPHRVVLHVPGTRVGDVEITYGFEQQGNLVQFNRTLQFDASSFPDDGRRAIERQMETDSVEGLRRLKALVEETLVKSQS